MPNITRKQADLLEAVCMFDEERFPFLLEKYTGLQAKPVFMYQIFDGGDDYVGNTHNDTLSDILRKAGIEVTEDG